MDRDHLRRVADTRPGYATYPDTRPGSPHWLRPRQPGPCTWADRPGAGLICVRADHRHNDQVVAVPAAVEQATPRPATAPTAAAATPSRRWWHRLAPWRSGQ